MVPTSPSSSSTTTGPATSAPSPPTGSPPAVDVEATLLADQLIAEAAQLNTLDEAYNVANLKLSQIDSQVTSTQSSADQLKAQVAKTRQLVVKAAVATYMESPPRQAELQQVVAPSHDQVMSQALSSAVTVTTDRQLSEYRTQEGQLQTTLAKLKSDQANFANATKTAKAARDQAATVLVQQQQTLSQLVPAMLPSVLAHVSGAGGNLLLAALQQAGLASYSGAPPPPLPSGVLGTVIQTAESELGKPYVWGGAGPGGFDCSGLTMVAWASVGVSLTHSAAIQYTQTQRVALTGLEPGDLLFYDYDGPGGIDHVTMYVGNNLMIAAAHTGTNVSIYPISYGNLVGAGRPVVAGVPTPTPPTA